MGIIKIRKAQREGARLVLGLAGISGSGKTRTALEIAYGLANYNADKVGFLDTENRRGSLYADVLRNPDGQVQEFWIGDLDAPFSPQRYIDAILEFQKHGVEVLVIDSITHEWEGTGGCEEIAMLANSRMPDWKKAKAEHKRFMNAMLQSDMHIIACIRAREKVEVTKEKNPQTGKIETVVKPIGVHPITEKNVMFEMTASLMMWNEGKTQQRLKVPEELMHILGREQGYISAADGKALRDWVDGAKQINGEIEAARNALRTVCEQGMQALQKAWRGLPENIRTALGDNGQCPADLKASAKAFDELRASAAANDNSSQLEDLNNQVMGNATEGATQNE